MFKEYEMQKHFEREQKLNQMTEKEREQFLLKEKKIESEKEVKHKLDPVCMIINIVSKNFFTSFNWVLF